MLYFITFYSISVSFKFYYRMAILFCQACAGIPPEQGKEPSMGNILFEHNQRAYEAAVEMMEATGRAAVIHPTGTGKSFIAFKLCADHEKESICWLSPSEYIFATQEEKWRQAGGKTLENIEFFTYAKLMRRKEKGDGEELLKQKPSFIILDEFHRLGAARWGGGVEWLRSKYPQAKVLGLSATNIRYLDNQRDMAWELFGGNIASELTLGAAIAGGILPAPKYVLSVYSYQKELERYQARIKRTKNRAVREKAQEELQALRRALGKADGLKEVFARHMLPGGEKLDGNGRNGDGENYSSERGTNGCVIKKAVLGEGFDFKKEKFGSKSELIQGSRMGEEGIPQSGEAHAGESHLGEDHVEELHPREAHVEELHLGEDHVEELHPREAHVEELHLEKAHVEELHLGEDHVEELHPREAHAGESHLGEAEAHLEESHLGKYIVFCANFDHLNEMKGLATEWFCGVDPEPHIYTAYADDPKTGQEFKAFKADKSAHLKLLYCIDMLNEGIHVEGVDGVILLRPTVSPTIYKQQVGRALAAGGKKTPIIFDIVMNIENLCSIGAVEEEWKEAVYTLRGKGGEDKTFTGHFQIIDEVKDCRRLFTQLNETLTASWDAMYAWAREYYKAHGHLDIPAAYTTADGHSLGAWVATQRKVYLGRTAGCLSVEQIKRLEEIGMCWQGSQEAAWERNFLEAEKYFKEHGNLAVPADYVTAGGCRLGRWIRRQREVYQKLVEPGKYVMVLEDSRRTYEGRQQRVHLERMQRLMQIGMVLENADPWEQKFELARRYYEDHGNLRMAADYVVEGVWLERWLREQKMRMEEEADSGENNIASDGKSRSPLTKGQRDKLLSIGIRPGVSQAELSWREQYSEAEEFYYRYGNLDIPKRYRAENGKNLGVWLQHQRTNRRNGRLAGWQVCLLDGIGMVWESPDAWEVGFTHAEEYVQQTGNLEVPNAYVCADGYRLGKWISNQRCAYGGVTKKGLGEERVYRLEEIGMVWNVGQGRRMGVCRTGKRK